MLILLNDVSNEVSEAGLIVGDADPIASSTGEVQAVQTSEYLHSKVDWVDDLYTSDASRLLKLIHRLREDSKNGHLTRRTLHKKELLRERSFGVLNRTRYTINSDIFTHTRIAPEGGESVFQVRSRGMKFIEGVCSGNFGKSILFLSHPFFCQIISNCILKKDHTVLTEFWQKKGSFILVEFIKGRFGIQWTFKNAYNAIEDTTYTANEIYSGILGEAGTPANQSA